jgi:hypothetical protein
VLLEAVSKLQIRFKDKAQADEKAAHIQIGEHFEEGAVRELLGNLNPLLMEPSEFVFPDQIHGRSLFIADLGF